MALTEKKRRFCEEYTIDSCGQAAARRAGYAPKWARTWASRLLDEPEVQEHLQKLRAAQAKRCEIKADDVLREIARVAFADPRKVMTWGPDGVRLRDSGELTDDEAAIVSEVSETTSQNGGSLKLKTHDKMKALELLGRNLGLFRDDRGGEDLPMPVKVVVEVVDGRTSDGD